jgi:hypothetical protein
MSSGCYCDCDEGESPEVSWSQWRIARKIGKPCCECLEPINPGERYEMVSGKWDGEFLSFKFCSFCSAERDRYARDNEWTPAFGQLACALYCELEIELIQEDE